MMNTIRQTFVILIIVLAGCSKQSRTKTELELFWQNRPTNHNPLELCGYERSFADKVTPLLVDEMVADLRQNPSDYNMGVYSLVIYYMPRPATTNRLAALRDSSLEKQRTMAAQLAKRVTQIENDNRQGRSSK